MEDPQAIDVPPPPPFPALTTPALASMQPVDNPAATALAPLNALRALLQPMIGPMLCDVAYLESVKRNASPAPSLSSSASPTRLTLKGKPAAGPTRR